MKSFLLLVFSLMAVCEDSSEVKGRANGWFEFTCKYPDTTITRYKYTEVVIAKNKRTIRSNKNDEWEKDDRVSLYHDTKNKNLRVVIRQLEQEDFGEYECKFYQEHDSTLESNKVEVNNDDEVFQTFTQTTSRTAETTITCENTGNKHDVQFFCKENHFICEEILSTTSVPKSNGTFTLIKSNSGFNISISDVSSQDDGVYWCGVKSNDGNYRAGLRKIQLEVKASVFPTQSTSTKTPGEKPTAGFVPPITTTASITAPDPSVNKTAPDETPGRSYITVTVVFVALLVFLIILVVVYKRIKSQISKESQTNKEDHYYEEIQERPHKSDSRTAMKMVYATANFPTNPSDIIDDSTVTANKIYCTVGEHGQHSTYSTVNNSSVFSENPLYYTVNLPQNRI